MPSAGMMHPALDLAIVTAERVGLPVFAYQGLSKRYRYASDRHHAFILEGARDTHNEISSLGIASAFRLDSVRFELISLEQCRSFRRMIAWFVAQTTRTTLPQQWP